MKRFAAVLTVCFFLTGCAGALRNQNITPADVEKATNRVYEGIELKKVKEATRAIFDEMKKNLSCVEEGNQITVINNEPSYWQSSNIATVFQLIVTFEEKDGRVLVKTVYKPTGTFSDYTTPQSIATGNLVLGRLDYFLGKSKKWVSCDKLNGMYSDEYPVMFCPNLQTDNPPDAKIRPIFCGDKKFNQRTGLCE